MKVNKAIVKLKDASVVVLIKYLNYIPNKVMSWIAKLILKAYTISFNVLNCISIF